MQGYYKAMSEPSPGNRWKLSKFRGPPSLQGPPSEAQHHQEWLMYPFPQVPLNFFFSFLGLQPWHVGVPRLGTELELQLPAYTTVTATQDPSRVCNLHHSSQH